MDSFLFNSGSQSKQLPLIHCCLQLPLTLIFGYKTLGKLKLAFTLILFLVYLLFNFLSLFSSFSPSLSPSFIFTTKLNKLGSACYGEVAFFFYILCVGFLKVIIFIFLLCFFSNHINIIFSI